MSNPTNQFPTNTAMPNVGSSWADTDPFGLNAGLYYPYAPDVMNQNWPQPGGYSTPVPFPQPWSSAAGQPLPQGPQPGITGQTSNSFGPQLSTPDASWQQIQGLPAYQDVLNWRQNSASNQKHLQQAQASGNAERIARAQAGAANMASGPAGVLSYMRDQGLTNTPAYEQLQAFQRARVPGQPVGRLGGVAAHQANPNSTLSLGLPNMPSNLYGQTVGNVYGAGGMGPASQIQGLMQAGMGPQVGGFGITNGGPLMTQGGGSQGMVGGNRSGMLGALGVPGAPNFPTQLGAGASMPHAGARNRSFSTPGMPWQTQSDGWTGRIPSSPVTPSVATQWWANQNLPTYGRFPLGANLTPHMIDEFMNYGGAIQQQGPRNRVSYQQRINQITGAQPGISEGQNFF